ncbi:MAG: hypothetical protein WA633_00465 [Stellaceae bacterium]
MKAVLAEYRDQLPLIVRQIFYRLVGAYGYEKTELAADRLQELLTKARRARLVPMDWIRDDGFVTEGSFFYENASAFLTSLTEMARELRLDRQKYQKRRLYVWCEAAGMVPQLARVANPFGVDVCSSSGFDSLTAKHRMGRLWAGSAVTMLYIGDHDQSGVHVFGNLAEEVRAFAAAYGEVDIECVRLAVTPEQAEAYKLPSAPPKATDNRRFEGNETWQAEALDPRTLADILRAAIEGRIDRTLFEAVLEEEAEAPLYRA